MNGNIRVGSLFGIPFYVDPSWFLVLGLVTWTYGEEIAEITRLPGLLPWIWGFVTALLLFASVLAHELGHSLMAIVQGIKVKSITLFFFGGLALLEKESKTPLESFLVAIAGPAVSFLLFLGLGVVKANLEMSLAVNLVITLVAYLNLVLGVFNLIPGLPLDGGNVLKAIVWKITGDPNKGILLASRFGQVFGGLAIGIGVLSAFNVLPFGSIWTAFIGLFLLRNANLAAQSVQVQERLEGIKAVDVMIPKGPIASEDLNLRQFVNDYVIGQKDWKRFLLTDTAGQLSGLLTVESLKSVPTSLWSQTPLSQIMEKAENISTIPAETPLLEVLQLMEQETLSELIVISQTKEVIGLLDRVSISEFLQKQSSTPS